MIDANVAGFLRPRAIAFGAPTWVWGWALAAFIACSLATGPALRQDFSDPDNAMRLVQVRDFLAGQDWYDTLQNRLGPSPGTHMHWARWIDALIAVPIKLLAPVVGVRTAEIATAFIWPLGLLAAFMFAVGRLCAALVPPESRAEASVTGPILAAVALPIIVKFAPGSFDHHNVVLILGALAATAIVGSLQSPRAAAIAGIALALAVGTAAEAMPLLVLTVGLFGVLWLVAPQKHAGQLAWFGGSLCVSALVVFLVLVPPARWAAPVCDAMSRGYLGVGLVSGAGAIALAFAGRLGVFRRWQVRLLAGGSLAVGGGLALMLAFPECRGGGYGALSEDFKSLWLAHIAEARSMQRLLGEDLPLFFAFCCVALSGTAMAVWRLARGERSSAELILGAFLVLSVALMGWQIRGAALATTFATPFLTLAFMRARSAYRANPQPRRLLAIILCAATASSAAWAEVGSVAGRFAGRTETATRAAGGSANAEPEDVDCSAAASVAPLAGLPQGHVLGTYSEGPAMLLHAPHAVLAAPYHRNETGTMGSINAFRSEAEAARSIAARFGADYVVVCPSSPELEFYADAAMSGVARRDTLAARMMRGDHPSWLVPLDLGDTPIRAYRVLRD